MLNPCSGPDYVLLSKGLRYLVLSAFREGNVSAVSTKNETADFLDVTAPGSLPFIDFDISEFDELVAATEQLQGLGHSVVRTPAGPGS